MGITEYVEEMTKKILKDKILEECKLLLQSQDSLSLEDIINILNKI